MTDPCEQISFTLPCGLVLQADAWGDPAAPAILFAHGGGQTRHSWGGTAAQLGRSGWYAVAYDHRGHGQSGWASDGNYALQQFAADLSHLACSFKQPPIIVGASLGGLSAMLASGEADSAPFRAVVLVDITPRMNQAGAANIIGFMSERIDEGFASLQEAAELIAAYTKRPLRKDVSGLKKNLRLGDDGRYRWHWDPEFTRQRINSRDLGLPERMEKAAARMREPILLVRGARSDLVTEELAREFLQMVPHAEYVDVADAHHMVAGDRNDVFSAAVIDFIDRLPSQA